MGFTREMGAVLGTIPHLVGNGAGAANTMLRSDLVQHTESEKKASQAPLRRDSRKRSASSQRGCSHSGLAKPRPQPAALVSGGVQSKYANAAATQASRSPKAPGRKPTLEVVHPLLLSWAALGR